MTPAFRDRLLADVFPEYEADVVLRSEDLLEDGLLDSLGVVDIVACVSEWIGRDLPLEGLTETDFRSVSAIEGLASRFAAP